MSNAGEKYNKLDIGKANQEMLSPTLCRLYSLSTVLTQEVDLFNKLLKVIKVIKVRLTVKETSLKGSRTLQLKDDFSERH